MQKLIYLDHQSTSPLDPRVLEAMVPYFGENFGNPSNKTHAWGWQADTAVEKARSILARSIGAHPSEIIFSGSATESNNLAILGLAAAFEKSQRRHIITTRLEHASVLEPMHFLEKRGWSVTYLESDEWGRVSPEALAMALRPETVLASIIFANNEIGTLQRIEEMGRICKQQGVFFHTDATQAIGKIPVNIQKFGIDLMSWNAHKINGPKGVGALYLRRKSPRVALEPILFGGGHEKNLRPGTLNVPAIVGFGRSMELAHQEMGQRNEHLRSLQQLMLTKIQSKLDQVILNGHPIERLSNNLNFTFLYVDAQALLTALPQIGLSTGSACGTSKMEPSHILKAIGRSDEEIRSSIRISFGKDNTYEEVGYVADRIVEMVEKLRELSPLLPHDLRIRGNDEFPLQEEI